MLLPHRLGWQDSLLLKGETLAGKSLAKLQVSADSVATLAMTEQIVDERLRQGMVATALEGLLCQDPDAAVQRMRDLSLPEATRTRLELKSRGVCRVETSCCGGMTSEQEILRMCLGLRQVPAGISNAALLRKFVAVFNAGHRRF